MEKVIEVKDLVKKFGKFTAVNGISFDIFGGQIFALLGENGAGKTTTIKILCNLLKKDGGSVKIFGYDSETDANKINTFINVSPQETAVAPNLTVKENLVLIAKIYGQKKEQAILNADKIVEELKLKDEENKKAKTLSGGMQRRLSIGMALVTSPKILFLDEPTLGLDVRARRNLWKIIEALKGKITVILTTHYLEEAEALSDNMVVMKKGRIIAEGSAKELKEKTGSDNIEDMFLSLMGEE